METGTFVGRVTGPSGDTFNFGDARSFRQPQPALFWFAEKTDDPSLLAGQVELPWHEQREVFVRQMPLAAIWWSRLQDVEVSEAAADPVWRGRGEQPLAVFRGPDGAGQWFLATKGGSASISHGHMDAGSFVLEAMGQRWAVDLGMQDYHRLESLGLKLFQGGQDGDRWKVFANNHLSHNTLTINGRPHRVNGHATMIEFDGASPTASATYDLYEIFGGQVGSATRRFEFNQDKEAVRITDALRGIDAGARVRWAMLTPARVTLQGSTAILQLGDESLRVKSSGSTPTRFAQIDPATLMAEFDVPLPGLTLLVLEAETPASGEVNFDVRLLAHREP
jgi:hypothetical protein